MTTPRITLRRNPTFAMIGLLLGLALVVAGTYFSYFYLVFPGVMAVLISVLLTLNPFAVVTDKHVELRSLFGNSQAKYDHDGFHLLLIDKDRLHIQKGDQRAPLNRVSKEKVQGGDWAALEAAIQGAQAAHSKSKR